jgi:hypothetical protein
MHGQQRVVIGVVQLPEGIQEDSAEAVLIVLQACQNSIMATISDLMSNATRAGGGEASILLWRRRSILITLQESASYAATEFDSKSENLGRNAL